MSGLNVIAGASNTGKSLLVELIRFGLGAQELRKQVPEAAPYDRLFLVIEDDSGTQYTIERALAGADVIVYDGDVSDRPSTPVTTGTEKPASLPENPTPADIAKPADGRILPVRSNATSEETLPGFLLGLSKFAGHKIKDKQASTRNLSFRDLRELVIVDEQRIISTDSPAHSGDRTARTAEEAVFSFLLTSVDDSAVVLAEQAAEQREEHKDKAQKIAFMLDELRADVPEGETLRSTRAQLKRLEKSIVRAQDSYNQGFASVSAVETERRNLIAERSQVRARVEALNQLIERFNTLQDKYESDLQRLSAVGEAAEHFATLEGGNCPVCGSTLSTDSSHHKAVTDDPLVFFQGIEAERQKIVGLKRDLADTINVLTGDISAYSQRAVGIAEELRLVEERLNRKLKPATREESEKLGKFMETRADIREILNNLERIEKYKNQRNEELAAVKRLAHVDLVRNDAKAKMEFSLVVENILKAWKYPEAGRVHVDDKTHDLIINGKRRDSLGKGYRAITASAFLVGLMEYCQSSKLAHPGFVVLDTPVRTFKDRKHGEGGDEVISDEVKDAFFTDLAVRFQARQVIVAENDEPPKPLLAQINYIFFSGSADIPPQGFIPPFLH